jgi:hypothetical protein
MHLRIIMYYLRRRFDDLKLILESSSRVRFGEQTESPSVIILFLKAGFLFLVMVEFTIDSEIYNYFNILNIFKYLY